MRVIGRPHCDGGAFCLFQLLCSFCQILLAGLAIPRRRIQSAVAKEGRRGDQIHLGVTHELRGHRMAECMWCHVLDLGQRRVLFHGVPHSV
jgi:hypothetical protein